jgi:hypothetical protein
MNLCKEDEYVLAMVIQDQHWELEQACPPSHFGQAILANEQKQEFETHPIWFPQKEWVSLRPAVKEAR